MLILNLFVEIKENFFMNNILVIYVMKLLIFYKFVSIE